MNIAEFYKEKIGDELARDFTGLPVESKCGRHCSLLILAGVVLIEAIRNTHPDEQAQPHIDTVKALIVEGCEVYYFG
jgi:hypothetical protein